MRLISLVVIIVFLGFSCQRFGKNERIPEKEMVKILADIHIADAISFSLKYRDKFRNNDTATYYDKLFAKYGVTRQQFDSTVSWYSGNPEKYNLLYDKVLDRLNRMAAEINEKMRKDSVKTQDGNLWNKKRDWTLPEDGVNEEISFAVKVEKKGYYRLSARIKINPSDQSDRPFMTAFSTRERIMKHGAPDTTGKIRLDKSGNFRQYSLSILLDKDTATYIKGYILGSEYKPGSWIKNAEVRDIRLEFVPETETSKIE